MTGIENVDTMAVCTRVFQVFFGSFIYIFLVAKQVGPENKKLWFRKRKKYTFFNRRGIFGHLRCDFWLRLLVYFCARILSVNYGCMLMDKGEKFSSWLKLEV